MKNHLYITAAQINPIVGDISGNAEKIITNIVAARDQQKADIIVFPEMVLTGYPPEDLLLRQELYQQTRTALKRILTKTKNIYVILGAPTKEQQKYFNTAIVMHNGKIIAHYHKQTLPNYGVFDEKRYFTAGTKTCIVNIKNNKIAITVCEDLWFKEPAHAAKKMQAQLIISINASPFDRQKPFLREQILSQRARENKLPIVYVNMVGGQDELIFDGGSMVINESGFITKRAPFFKEKLMQVNFALDTKKIILPPKPAPKINTIELIYNALVLGVRDYIEKNNFTSVIVSTSGGIDSALTLAIAVDALGKDRVETIYLPSRYSSKLSGKIAREEAAILGVKYSIISIESVFKAFLKSLPKEWAKHPKNSMEQNIQARCRAIILMAFANKKGSIVLSTGNKSEMAVGYATLYGDMVGGVCVLKDVSKTLVYQLARYRNKISCVIPQAAIDRTPTAELAYHQKDSDDLPPYPILDKILERYIELNQPLDEIARAGFNKKLVMKVINMVNKNEYKRRQAPPGIKITTRAFGRERRYPITARLPTL